MPIVMGMVAGVFLRFGLDWVRAFQGDRVIAAPMTAVFLLAGTAPAAVSARLPPLIVALAAGAGVIAATGTFAPGLDQVPLLAEPRLHLPEFSWTAMVELVVPLAITVLVVQNGQGIAVLTAAGHTPPINAIAVACGVGSARLRRRRQRVDLPDGPRQRHHLGGGRKHSQYTAGVIVGAARAGIRRAVAAVHAAPAGGTAGLHRHAGGPGHAARAAERLRHRLPGRFALGALVTFLVTVADIPILNIGAAFWGLLAGLLVSLLLERPDFATQAG